MFNQDEATMATKKSTKSSQKGLASGKALKNVKPLNTATHIKQ